MAGKCSQESCFPDETGCNVEGCSTLVECKYYNQNIPTEDENTESENTESESKLYRIPWTGNSFGLTDLNFLTASSKPILVGISGVASAGKTTFLASLYCLIRNGEKIGDYSFSGSLTLSGWENIAWYLSWKHDSSIQFPPHTSNDSGRVPGLLHLSMKNNVDEKIDLIFTDAPGEWFDAWRININNENAKGAKWIYDNCDAFLLFADSEMLISQKRGLAKQQINSVVDRLCQNIKKRPIGLIWSKSDIEIKEDTREQIISHIEQNFLPHFSQFKTSVKEGENKEFYKNITYSISWLIKCLQSNKNTNPEIISYKPEDMFLSKRVINE